MKQKQEIYVIVMKSQRNDNSELCARCAANDIDTAKELLINEIKNSFNFISDDFDCVPDIAKEMYSANTFMEWIEKYLINDNTLFEYEDDDFYLRIGIETINLY